MRCYTGTAKLDGLPFNLAVMNFRFMGGSMGSVVGEKIARLARRSLEKKIPLVIVSTSGGARMQEGVLSLMQMAKTSAAIAQLHRECIPYISILTDPTTGGVSASFAMQGDVVLAEPGAVIGFAGQRVIKQTIGQDLPDGFQTAEFLLEHGQIDDVVPRASLRDTTARLAAAHAGAASPRRAGRSELRSSGSAAPTPHPRPASGGASSFPAVTSWPCILASPDAADLRTRRSSFSSPGPPRSSSGWPTTRALLKSLGNPHEVMPSVHIGGTNGKGSVCDPGGRGAPRGRLARGALHLART